MNIEVEENITENVNRNLTHNIDNEGEIRSRRAKAYSNTGSTR